jgi:AcrR family transcriptional regulator
MSGAQGQAAVAERPLRADARRNRERVLAAAEELFAEQGASVQMADVARRAGVGVGTVCRNFPTKEALVGALLDDMLEPLVVASERRWRTGPGRGPAPYVEAMADLQAAPQVGRADVGPHRTGRAVREVGAAAQRRHAATPRTPAVRRHRPGRQLLCGIAQSAVLAGDVGGTRRRRYGGRARWAQAARAQRAAGSTARLRRRTGPPPQPQVVDFLTSSATPS